MSMTETSTEIPPLGPAPTLTPSRSEPAPAPLGLASDEADRNPVFTSLVTDDADVVGLIAYSIYKQNKHDWLLAFAKAKGRDPEEAEISAYILGESTPRRLATYRHLAQATLDGKGPDVHVGSTGRGLGVARYGSKAGVERPLARVLGYVITGVVVFVAVLLAIRFGLVSSK